MTRYKELWEKEQVKTRKLAREIKDVEQYRDRYLAFIQDGRQEEFMNWLLDETAREAAKKLARDERERL